MEDLTFKIGLSGTFFDKVPAYSILLDGVKYASGKASISSELVEFDASIEEDCKHLLEIRLENKTLKDTIVENGTIIKDMLLNIDSISIDDIDIGELKWSLSEVVGDDPSRPTLKECVNLGWNGSYKLEFESPYYLWLLEKM